MVDLRAHVILARRFRFPGVEGGLEPGFAEGVPGAFLEFFLQGQDRFPRPALGHSGGDGLGNGRGWPGGEGGAFGPVAAPKNPQDPGGGPFHPMDAVAEKDFFNEEKLAGQDMVGLGFAPLPRNFRMIDLDKKKNHPSASFPAAYRRWDRRLNAGLTVGIMRLLKSPWNIVPRTKGALC